MVSVLLSRGTHNFFGHTAHTRLTVKHVFYQNAPSGIGQNSVTQGDRGAPPTHHYFRVNAYDTQTGALAGETKEGGAQEGRRGRQEGWLGPGHVSRGSTLTRARPPGSVSSWLGVGDVFAWCRRRQTQSGLGGELGETTETTTAEHGMASSGTSRAVSTGDSRGNGAWVEGEACFLGRSPSACPSGRPFFRGVSHVPHRPEVHHADT